MKGKRLKILILLMTGVMLFCSSAWGVGINFHCNSPVQGGTAYDEGSGTLPIGSLVQRIYGNPQQPDPGGAHFLHSGTWQQDHHVGDGTSAAGKFDFNTSSSSSTYLRVWKGTAPAQGSWYKTLGSWPPGDPIPTSADISDFHTDYKADIPPPPTVTASGFKLTWDASKSMYLVDFNLTARNGTEYKCEVVDYDFRVKEAGTDWSTGKSKLDSTSATWGITENPADPYFVAGRYYVAVAQAKNYFGPSGWGTEHNFQIPAGEGTVAGPDSATYDLIKLDAGLGVNTFPIAYAQVTDPAIVSVRDMVEAINSQAGEEGPIVTAIGWWNASTQKPEGYMITIDIDSKTITGWEGTTDLGAPEDIALEKDKVYQISVLRNSTFSVTGLRNVTSP